MIWKTVSDELSELKPYMNWYHSHANGVIKAGGACDLLLYDSSGADAATNTTKFAESAAKYDALIVRINPGQLSQGTADGTQKRFDDLMNEYIAAGKLVWSSPKIQTQMGAKDALVNIGKLNCGLEDTYAYSLTIQVRDELVLPTEKEKV